LKAAKELTRLAISALLAVPSNLLIPVPAMMSPIPVVPIGLPVIDIPIRSPIVAGWVIPRTVISRIIVIPGPIINRAGKSDKNVNSGLRMADRYKSSTENCCENKKEFSHVVVSCFFRRDEPLHIQIGDLCDLCVNLLLCAHTPTRRHADTPIRRYASPGALVHRGLR
jgi:hypothetical protein